MKVSIVIPYWNGAEKIKKHLPEVLKFARENKVMEVIASDDASTDETVKLLKTQFPEVVVVEREKNEGFASNVNTGFSKASGDCIFLLNSDAAPGKDVLKYGLPHFENQKVFSVGCNVGGLWAIGKFENGFFWHGQGKADKGDEGNLGDKGDRAHRTLWASGGSSIFRKQLWDELGGLDTLYNPFYEEDLDLGYRATKRGYINIWEPRSIVEHYKEKGVIAQHFNPQKVSSVAQRNQLIFIWKNITSPKFTSQHQKALFKMLILHPGYWPTFLAATKYFPEIIRKRKIEVKDCKLTDEEVLAIFSSEN